MAAIAEFIKSFKTIFLAAFPEFSGYHYPIRAKVVKVNEAGGRVDEYNHRYSVNVQPLNPDGTVDTTAPVISDIEMPIMWAGPDRGVFSLPTVGTIVRIGFYHNDPAQPFLDAVLGYGFNCPAHPVGGYIIQHSDGKRFEITPEGKIKATMDMEVQGNLSVTKSLSVGANISASGSIIDGGGNTNHHSH